MFSIGKQKVRSKMTGFVEVSQNEMMVVDGGVTEGEWDIQNERNMEIFEILFGWLKKYI